MEWWVEERARLMQQQRFLVITQSQPRVAFILRRLISKQVRSQFQVAIRCMDLVRAFTVLLKLGNVCLKLMLQQESDLPLPTRTADQR